VRGWVRGGLGRGQLHLYCQNWGVRMQAGPRLALILSEQSCQQVWCVARTSLTACCHYALH
jgi:hypothetical protein